MVARMIVIPIALAESSLIVLVTPVVDHSYCNDGQAITPKTIRRGVCHMLYTPKGMKCQKETNM